MATSFKLEHDFSDIPLDIFLSHLLDPKLNQMLKDGLSFDERRLVERKETKGGMDWCFLVKKSVELPSAIKRILKADDLIWKEFSSFVRKDHCVYWKIVPELKLVPLRGEGRSKFSKKQDGCKRIIEGQITADIPLVGKMVEAFIVNELLKSYDIEPGIERDFFRSIMGND
jgi:hypothetical protein